MLAAPHSLVPASDAPSSVAAGAGALAAKAGAAAGAAGSAPH